MAKTRTKHELVLEVENLVSTHAELLRGCKMAYHTLSSLLAVRDGIPDQNLRDQAAFLWNAYYVATGDKLPRDPDAD